MRRDAPILVAGALLLSLVPASANSAVSELSLDERVRIQARIERVYHEHRIGEKRSFDEVYTPDLLRGNVSRYLRLSSALETLWGVPVTAAALRAEAERIERASRAPSRLAELQAALDHDALLFQECVARATLVERLARSFFAADERFGNRSWDAWVQELETRLPEPSPRPIADPGRLPLTAAAIAESDSCPPAGTWVPGVLDDRPDTRFDHAAVWTGSEMIVWGGTEYATDRLGFRYDPLTDTWAGMSSIDAPVGRSGHTAVWTGTEMIVWGGYSALGDGGRYDPAADRWIPLPTADAPARRRSHSAVWTGSEMIVWGGEWGGVELGDGARYDPQLDGWSPISSLGAPSARSFHSAVWTGSLMVVWGGLDAAGLSLEGGGRYDPGSDEWTSVSTSGGQAPSARHRHSAVWTGSEMVVWGGDYATPAASASRDDGARYDPDADSWSGVRTQGAPSQRGQHVAVWTGSEMIVWGGDDRNILRDDGGSYDPARNDWISMPSAPNSPSARSGHAAVWDGTRVLVYGGGSNSGLAPLADGARYDPATGSWSPISAGSGPEPRTPRSSTVWTGTEMLVWGGSDNDSGFRYDPMVDQWTSMADGAPAARADSTTVWTGTEMIVWGGGGCFDEPLASGGRYDPAADVWTLMSVTPAPVGRAMHSAVWTGTEMIVWGGCTATSLVTNSGGRYDPASDTWTLTPPTDAPEARYQHSAVWTGRQMIVWGGAAADGFELSSGGRFDPWTDAWTPTSTNGAPLPARHHAAVWSGEEMIVWGGYYEDPLFFTGVRDTGGRYDPGSDVWAATGESGAPAARGDHAGVWTGTALLVWGGTTLPGSGNRLRSGGLYDPSSDGWAATEENGAPPGRGRFGMVFSGEFAMLWGGGGEQGDTPRAEGSQYAIDTDGDGFANACDDDDDDDGVPDLDDCDAVDAGVDQLPSEVASVVVTSHPTELSWAAIQARHDVIGGTLAGLVADGGLSGASCLDNDLPGNSWIDPRPDPAANEGVYYLIRAQNPCGSGTLGVASSGAPRQAGSACP